MSILERFRLDGKTALVTGGARGLGKAMARGMAEVGANIALVDLLVETAEQTRDELREIGVESRVYEADVTEFPQVEETVASVVDDFGGVDVLLNNAGIARSQPAEEMSMKNWHDVIDVNLNAVYYCAREVGRPMIDRGGGTIVNMSSMSGIIANYPQPQVAYNAAKAGVTMITRSLASEWAKHGIRVNEIAPGYMNTEMTHDYLEQKRELVQKHWIDPTPMQRVGEPEELAAAAVYLASEASSFTTGATLVVDGGYIVR